MRAPGPAVGLAMFERSVLPAECTTGEYPVTLALLGLTAKLLWAGAGAAPNISLAHSRPFRLPLELAMVERHPLGSQAFFPLNDRPFLVVVAPDGNGAPGRPLAFLTNGRQGVNYRRNVWHGILTPLDREQSFLIVDRKGDGDNLEEHFFDTPYVIAGPAS